MKGKSTHDIFISYSTLDEDKIKLIENELKNHPFFKLTIIASNREPLQPLTQKVIAGISNCDVIIPILTHKSITTQWINQEIGFATAKEVPIKPIVEKDMIDSLKGFIHKQYDLPYTYSSNINRGQENKNFLRAFRVLISDLQKESELISTSTRQSTLAEKAEEVVVKRQFREKVKHFLSDAHSWEYISRAFVDFSDILDARRTILGKSKIHISTHYYPASPFLLFRSQSNSILIHCTRPSSSDIKGNVLHVELWHGLLSTRTVNPQTDFDSGIPNPHLVAASQYTYAMKEDGSSGWRSLTEDEFYDNERIIDATIEWLLEKELS